MRIVFVENMWCTLFMRMRILFFKAPSPHIAFVAIGVVYTFYLQIEILFCILSFSPPIIAPIAYFYILFI